LPELRRSLDELAERFEYKGRILIPRRPIVEMRLNPVWVRWGRRNYDEFGGGVGFLLAHIDVYGDMSPTELYKFDGGLYRKLMREGNLDVLKRKVRNYDEYGGGLGYFLAHIDVYGDMSPKELYEFDSGLYCKLRKEGNLHVLKRKCKPKGQLSDLEQQRITSLYQECNGNTSEAARRLGYSQPTILKYWRRAGLPIRKHGRRHFSEKTEFLD
jgi:hypothetical protein